MSSQVRRNAHVEIMTLSTGCLGACTYCKTKHARGQLGSYELQALSERAAQAAAEPLVSHSKSLCCWKEIIIAIDGRVTICKGS